MIKNITLAKNEALTRFTNPQLIEPNSLNNIISSLKDFEEKTFDFEEWVKEEARLKTEKIDNIFVIPIKGVFCKNVSDFEKAFFGIVDTIEIEEAIREALKDESIEGILLDVDSPGGDVNGTIELGDLIAQGRSIKPILAHCENANSAAIWTAASCTMITAYKTSSVGSIGVYIPYVNLSEYHSKLGIKYEIFASGKFKGMGFGNGDLSEEQKNYLIERVNFINNLFQNHILENRGKIKAEDMEGQSFLGMIAKEKGLVDEIVKTKQESFDLLQELIEAQF